MIQKRLVTTALVLSLSTVASVASALPDASLDAARDGSSDASGDAAHDASRAAPRAASSADADNEDLIRMGAGLLDNGDLIQMGANLLEEDAGPDADAGSDAESDAEVDGGEVPASTTIDAAIEPTDAAAAPSAGDAASPDPNASKSGGGLGGGYSRDARIASGANVEPQGPKESPFAKLGVPAKAVPVVATAATAGAMALWPFLIKTITGLLKGIIGGLLKVRAKKDKKIDTSQRKITIFGFVLRPAELGSLLVAALTYGLAVTYTLQGWKMTVPFVRRQEILIVVIYFSRSVVRFLYEKIFKITTQYKFWPGGGLLCLGSAYLGNTLGTVGFELESSSGPEDAKRIVKMKAWLIVLALFMAVGFCIANRHDPSKLLQSGRIMLSGMALGEIMPITPMPGLKIYKWRKDVWAALFILVVPTFFIINLIL